MKIMFNTRRWRCGVGGLRVGGLWKVSESRRRKGDVTDVEYVR